MYRLQSHARCLRSAPSGQHRGRSIHGTARQQSLGCAMTCCMARRRFHRRRGARGRRPGDSRVGTSRCVSCRCAATKGPIAAAFMRIPGLGAFGRCPGLLTTPTHKGGRAPTNCDHKCPGCRQLYQWQDSTHWVPIHPVRAPLRIVQWPGAARVAPQRWLGRPSDVDGDLGAEKDERPEQDREKR
jgi:hypothetical protein